MTCSLSNVGKAFSFSLTPVVAWDHITFPKITDKVELTLALPLAGPHLLPCLATKSLSLFAATPQWWDCPMVSCSVDSVHFFWEVCTTASSHLLVTIHSKESFKIHHFKTVPGWHLVTIVDTIIHSLFIYFVLILAKEWSCMIWACLQLDVWIWYLALPWTSKRGRLLALLWL